jgi:hypothetical protein
VSTSLRRYSVTCAIGTVCILVETWGLFFEPNKALSPLVWIGYALQVVCVCWMLVTLVVKVRQNRPNA